MKFRCIETFDLKIALGVPACQWEAIGSAGLFFIARGGGGGLLPGTLWAEPPPPLPPCQMAKNVACVSCIWSEFCKIPIRKSIEMSSHRRRKHKMIKKSSAQDPLPPSPPPINNPALSKVLHER